MQLQFFLIEGAGSRRSIPLLLAGCLPDFSPGPSFKAN